MLWKQLDSIPGVGNNVLEVLTWYSKKKSKSDLADKEYSNDVVEHILYSPARGSSLLYVAMFPLASILSVDSTGLVIVTTDLVLLNENRMSIDLVKTDAVKSTQFSDVCLFLLPLSSSNSSVVNLPTLSANSTKASKSSIQLTTMPYVSLAME